jgi:hypothetical protein
MTTDTPYFHTQKSPLCLLVYGTAIVLLVGAWFSRDESQVAAVLGVIGVVSLLLAASFHHLTVDDQGDQLAITFGPIPLFRRAVRYADIEKVEVGRTLILDGWGIHLSFRGGWIWNIWGRDCVVVRWKNGGMFQIGTDDADKLARFVEGKIGQRREGVS